MEEHTKEKTKEIYAIDAQKDINMIMAGGGDDAVTFYTFNGTEYVIDEVVEGFEDSIIMVGFASKNKAFAVSMDGTVAEIEISLHGGRYEKDVQIVDLQIDISKAILSQDKSYIYIGTEDGRIERIRATVSEVEMDRVWQGIGHLSAILEIIETKDAIYTLSKDQVIIFDKDRPKILARYSAEENSDIQVMQINKTGKSVGIGYASGLVCILAYSPTQKTLTSVYKYDSPNGSSVESIGFIEDLLLYGDFKSTVTIIDTKYKTVKRCTISEEEMCVIKIITISPAVSISVTNTGKISVIGLTGDIKVLSEYTTDTITLDAILFNRYVCAATVEGVVFLPLT